MLSTIQSPLSEEFFNSDKFKDTISKTLISYLIRRCWEYESIPKDYYQQEGKFIRDLINTDLKDSMYDKELFSQIGDKQGSLVYTWIRLCQCTRLLNAATKS